VAAATGTKARAAATGKVLYAGTPVQAYGPLVILEHPGGLHTVYSNLREALVAKGAQVEVGDVVGVTGEISRSLPPHLHFEVRKKGEPIDPLLVLPPP
jgi:lipoprotein NlpD